MTADEPPRSLTRTTAPAGRNPQRVFERAFSVADIARPLLSFDSTTPASDAKTSLESHGEQVVGVRSGGSVRGFLAAAELRDGRCGDVSRPIEESDVDDDSLPLAPLVLRLRERPSLFVSALGQICGTVGRHDFLQPAARMWLFGMITLLELRLTRMIDSCCRDGSWAADVSEGRLRKAESLLAERSRRNGGVRLLDCLQFADKAQIVASRPELRTLTRFDSRRQAENVGKRLERLRNNLAHSQDVVTEDWDTIVALAENLGSVVSGPKLCD